LSHVVYLHCRVGLIYGRGLSVIDDFFRLSDCLGTLALRFRFALRLCFRTAAILLGFRAGPLGLFFRRGRFGRGLGARDCLEDIPIDVLDVSDRMVD
jgi:hypothetical protein